MQILFLQILFQLLSCGNNAMRTRVLQSFSAKNVFEYPQSIINHYRRLEAIMLAIMLAITAAAIMLAILLARVQIKIVGTSACIAGRATT